MTETTHYTATKADAAATGFRFNIYKTIDAGYTATFVTANDGATYTVGDQFVVTGDKLGGATTANDCTVTVSSSCSVRWCSYSNHSCRYYCS